MESWSRILSNVDPVHARMAVDEHFATKPETYLSVGHVVAGAKRQAWRNGESKEAEARKLEESAWKGEPCPICVHDIAIVRCDDCCGVLASQVSHLHGPDLWDWCDQNLLKVTA